MAFPLPPESPPQFSIRNLLVLQALVALFFGAVLLCRYFTIHLLMVITLIVAIKKVRPENARTKRLSLEFICGIVLPVLCLIYDPGIFRSSISPTGHRDGLSAFAFQVVIYQMTLFAVWMLGQWWFRRSAFFFAGTFVVGCVCAAILGVILFIPALIGSIVLGIGLPGWTPWLTLWAFRSNTRKAYNRANFFGGRRELLLFGPSGFFLALSIPFLIYFFTGDWFCNVLPSWQWNQSFFP